MKMFEKISSWQVPSALVAASLLMSSPRVLAQTDPCGALEPGQGTRSNVVPHPHGRPRPRAPVPGLHAECEGTPCGPGDHLQKSLSCPSLYAALRGRASCEANIRTTTRSGPTNRQTGAFKKAYADNLEHSTLATALQLAGYKTFLFGKYLNGYPATASQTYIPSGWHGWNSPVGGDPYGEYNYQMNDDGTIVTYGNQPSDYLTDVMSAGAVNFIRKTAQQATPPPFFMHLTPFAPHRPSTPAPRHANLFPTPRPRGRPLSTRRT